MQLITRRSVLGGIPGGILFLSAGVAVAQAPSPFIGTWAGQVEGIGEVRLVITGVVASGQVEGRMEFALNNFKAAFADKASPGPQPTSRGIVAGTGLVIDSAYGGTYELTLDGNTLAGSYTRGTTMRTKAQFARQ